MERSMVKEQVQKVGEGRMRNRGGPKGWTPV